MVEEGLLEGIEHEGSERRYALLDLLRLTGWEIAITSCTAGVRISARARGRPEIVREGDPDDIVTEVFKAAVKAQRRPPLHSIQGRR